MLLSSKEQIDRYRLSVLRAALTLECKGMTRRGRSVYAIIKEEFGFTGNKQTVLEKLDSHIKAIDEQ